MQVLVIVNQEVGHNAYKIMRFQEEFPKLGISLSVVTNDGTIGKVIDGKLVFNLPKCDCILYLDKDIYLARELERAGYRLFNRADFIKMCDDKMLTSIALANEDIKMPKTIAGPLLYTDIKESNYNFLDNVEETLGYPMVVKRVYGSLGESVYLANNKNELKELYQKLYRQPLLFQEYIPSSKGRSMRVLIIDGEVVGAFIRCNNGDFRSNFGVTASSTKLVGHQAFLDLAKKISNILNIEYAGIDFLFGENEEPILCEINSNAFFEEFEKVTGINVAYKYGEMLMKKIK